MREARRIARVEHGLASITNEYDLVPGSIWRDADEAARRRMLTGAISVLAVEQDFIAEDVVVIAIEHGVRVVIGFEGALAGADKQALLMAIEAGIKELVDRRLEIYLEELKDKNKLRRLAVVQG